MILKKISCSRYYLDHEHRPVHPYINCVWLRIESQLLERITASYSKQHRNRNPRKVHHELCFRHKRNKKYMGFPISLIQETRIHLCRTILWHSNYFSSNWHFIAVDFLISATLFFKCKYALIQTMREHHLNAGSLYSFRLIVGENIKTKSILVAFISIEFSFFFSRCFRWCMLH